MAFTTKIDEKKINTINLEIAVAFRLDYWLRFIWFHFSSMTSYEIEEPWLIFQALMRLQQIGYKPSWKNTWTIPNTRWPFWCCKALLPSDIFFSSNIHRIIVQSLSPFRVFIPYEKNWISHVEKASMFRVIISLMKNFIYISILSLWTSKSDFDFLKPF